MKPTLEDYFREFDGKTIEFVVKVVDTSDYGIEFVIYPARETAEPPTIWFEVNPQNWWQRPLTDRFGGNLERLTPQHKLFLVTVISERLRLNAPIEDTIDLLDPDAHIPDYLIDALRPIEPAPRRKLLDLLLYCLMSLLSESL